MPFSAFHPAALPGARGHQRVVQVLADGAVEGVAHDAEGIAACEGVGAEKHAPVLLRTQDTARHLRTATASVCACVCDMDVQGSED